MELKSSSELQVIGEGNYGIIIRPNIDCDNGNLGSMDKVGKITSHDILQREYDFIQKLPESPLFIDKKMVELCKLSEGAKKVIQQFSEEIDERNIDYQLSLPYLGIDFSKYIRQNYVNAFEYNNIIASGSELVGEKIMDIRTFKRITMALDELCQNIFQMNKMGIFHLDMKSNNIIYNENTSKFTLIDYNLSVNKKIPTHFIQSNIVKDYYADKYGFVDRLVLPFLYISLNNSYIYDEMLSLIHELEQLKFDLGQIAGKEYRPDEPIIQESVFDNMIMDFMKKLTDKVKSLDDNAKYTLKDNLKNPPLHKIKQLPASEQRKKAKTKYDMEIMKKGELTSMGREDVKYGGKAGKTKKNQNGKKTNGDGGRNKNAKRRKSRKNQNKKSQ